MIVFVACPAVQHQPIVDSESKHTGQMQLLKLPVAHKYLHRTAFIDVIYFLYPKYALRDHLSL